MVKVLFLMVFVLIPVNGLSCAFYISLEDKIHASGVFFTGKLVSLTCENNQRIAEFQVREVWRGEIQEKQIVIEESVGCAKSKYLNVGDNYSVVASGKTKNFVKVSQSTFCGKSYDEIGMYWYEWDKKTKYHKWLLNLWHRFAVYAYFKKNWFHADILSYWNPIYYKLGKPVKTYHNWD